MFESFARFASLSRKARNERLTARLLDSLPDHVQKDIGWKWTPRHRGMATGSRLDFDLL